MIVEIQVPGPRRMAAQAGRTGTNIFFSELWGLPGPARLIRHILYHKNCHGRGPGRPDQALNSQASRRRDASVQVGRPRVAPGRPAGLPVAFKMASPAPGPPAPAGQIQVDNCFGPNPSLTCTPVLPACAQAPRCCSAEKNHGE